MQGQAKRVFTEHYLDPIMTMSHPPAAWVCLKGASEAKSIDRLIPDSQLDMHMDDSSCWELTKCTAEALDIDRASTYWNQGRWKKAEVLEGLGLVLGEERLTSMEVCRAFDTYQSSNKFMSSRSLKYRQILYLILSNCFCSKSLLTQYQNAHPTHHLSRLIFILTMILRFRFQKYLQKCSPWISICAQIMTYNVSSHCDCLFNVILLTSHSFPQLSSGLMYGMLKLYAPTLRNKLGMACAKTARTPRYACRLNDWPVSEQNESMISPLFNTPDRKTGHRWKVLQDIIL